MLRVAIIGCGGISGVHARSIAETCESELVAVADCIPERVQKLAGEYGVKAYTDCERMLLQEKLDLVHLCTPHYLHAPMAVQCMEYGISVFSEKPPVISWEQLAEIKRKTGSGVQCDISAPRLGVCFQNRWNPEVQAAKEVIESGELGAVIGARGFVTWCRKESYYGDAWHGKLELEGGGVLINQGIHTLDLLQFLIGGQAEKIDALQGNLHLIDSIEVEDTFCARIQYPNATAVLYVTTGYASDIPPIVEIQCEKGTLRMEDSMMMVRKDGNMPEIYSYTVKTTYGKSYWGGGHQTAISHFHKSLMAGTPDLLDFESVEDTINLMLQLYDSARSKAVTVKR